GQCLEVKNVLVNGNVTFSVVHPGAVSEITWKKGSDLLVEFYGEKPHFYLLKDRANVTFSPITLSINKMTGDDGGTYTAEVMNDKQKTTTYIFSLKVWVPVPKPNITCSQEGNSTLFLCHSDLDVSYQWQDGSKTEPAGDQYSISHSSNKRHGPLTCVVTNPLSTNQTTIQIESCVQGENERGRTGLVIFASAGFTGIAGIAGVLWKRNKLQGQNRTRPSSQDISPDGQSKGQPTDVERGENPTD
ncbi:hypothetical protein GDO86_020071, partial [Hymenochirus boettgeri]